jgi:hypothetical protein
VIAAPATPDRTDLAAVLEKELRTLHRRSLVFVISDFLDGDELRDPPWREKLARLALRHDVIAVRVVDPLEIELPGAGWLELERIDDHLALDVDMRSTGVRERSRTRADARRARLEELFARARAEWIDLPIGEDLADPLVAFFRRRNAMRGGAR